jgi:hypothetical protein
VAQNKIEFVGKIRRIAATAKDSEEGTVITTQIVLESGGLIDSHPEIAYMQRGEVKVSIAPVQGRLAMEQP